MDNENDQPCADKMKFDTVEEAQKTALIAKWQRGTELKPYHCQHCQLWHLSTAD